MKKPEWLGSPPEFEDSAVSEVLEADVVVCGGGIAGVSAVRAAAEAGASCILLEKCTKPQSRSGQFAVLGGEFLKRWGVDNMDKAPEIVSHLMKECGYRVKQPILNTFMQNIGRDFDWYLDGLPEEGTFIADETLDPPPAGTKLHVMLMQHPVQEKYDISAERYPTYPYTIQFMPAHSPVMENNLDIAMKTGRVEARFSTPAKKLIRDEETGRVTGVYARSYDGKVIRVNAKKGVVLATGDYAGDKAMLAHYTPWVLNNPCIPCGIDPERKPANTGDGHKMGMWIGAKMEVGPHCVNAHNMGCSMGVTPFLQLDVRGKRFMNEDCPGQQLENQLGLLKDHTAWQIFDGSWKEEIPFMPMGHGACSHVLDKEAAGKGEINGRLLPFDGYANEDFLEGSVKRDQTKKADTLEELIALTGMPEEAALASIARYNELAEEGEDRDFGKSGTRMFPIKTPPFYAGKLTAAPMLCTHSGLESDECAHCLDENTDPIPGLYVAGNVQGNRIAVDYPTVLPGLSHSIALVYGRIAGENAVKGI